MKKVELLAPAGNIQKMKYAINYGADAVYMGGNEFSLRALADNFTDEKMKEAIDYAHEKGKRVYLTLNIFAHNDDVKKVVDYAKRMWNLGIDAFIVSDLGVLSLIKKNISDAEIHISTQANSTNYATVNAYYQLGAKRVILARELSLDEIKEIRKNVPREVELEMFVHGAMCISYSGRCLLSNYMSYRDSNKGNCAQACRWKYSLVEEKRPLEHYDIVEDEKGTYIFNSKDMCLIEHIDKLIEAGVDSLKIEGRMKSIFYVSSVIKGYRNVIDEYYNDIENYYFNNENYKEVSKVSHREFTTGFLFGKPNEYTSTNFESSSYIRDYQFIGIVKGYLEKEKMLWIEQRNNFQVGDEIEILAPYSENISFKVNEIFNNKFEKIEVANHPQMNIYIPWDGGALDKYTILRKRTGD